MMALGARNVAGAMVASGADAAMHCEDPPPKGRIYIAYLQENLNEMIL